VVDELYEENRAIVDKEIAEVDELFLLTAAKEDKNASEMELNHLMFEKEAVEK